MCSDSLEGTVKIEILTMTDKTAAQRRHTNCEPNEVSHSWKGGAREQVDDVFFAIGIKRRGRKADFATTWSEWRDLNSMGQLLSRPEKC